MKIETKRSDGIILIVVAKFLYIFALPLDSLHEYLKKCFQKFWGEIKLAKWEKNEIDGAFVEIWTIIWTAINIFIILPLIASASIVFQIIFAVILLLRIADFSQTFIVINLYTSDITRRSIARSYILLFWVILEIAAILSSIHFLISDKFYVGNELANWKNVYFYTLRNILTVGGGDITAFSSSASFFFGIMRVIEPMFGILVFTAALARAIRKQ